MKTCIYNTKEGPCEQPVLLRVVPDSKRIVIEGSGEDKRIYCHADYEPDGSYCYYHAKREQKLLGPSNYMPSEYIGRLK